MSNTEKIGHLLLTCLLAWSGTKFMHSSILLSINGAGARNGMRNQKTKIPGIEVRGRPQTIAVLRISRQKFKIVAHLRYEILATVELSKTAAMLAGESTREYLSIVHDKVTEQSSLEIYNKDYQIET